MNKRITPEEIEKIKELAKQGKNVSRIAAIINRDRSTVTNVLKKNGIKIESLSLQQLNTIRSMMKQGKSYLDIANAVHKDKVVLERILKEEYGFSDYNAWQAKKEILWGRTRLQELRDMYSSNKCTVKDIAKHFNCSENTIREKAKEMQLQKARCDQAVINSKRKQFVENRITEEVKKEMSRAGMVSLKNIAERLNVSVYYIARFLKKQPILYREIKGGKLEIPEFDEFQKDFRNAFMSNGAVALKYGVSEATISQARKQEFGEQWKTKRNTWCYRSTAEIKFEKILDDLHFAYVPQKYVGKWKYDYDLGFHLLIEIQGAYWHTDEHIKENDTEKKTFAENCGYTVLQIKEQDIDKQKKKVEKSIYDTLKEKIKQYYRFPKTL